MTNTQVSFAKQFVFDAQQFLTIDSKVTATRKTHRLATSCAIKRLGHRGPPVDDHWLAMLVGEAELARGHWQDALAPLERAVETARAEGDPCALSRCLGSLGRAHYRAGAFAALAAEGKMNAKDVARAIKTYNIDPEKANPIGV